MLPVMSWLRPREAALNARLAEMATRYGADVLDLFSLELAGDPAMWSADRIHGTSLAHQRIAAGMAEKIGLPGTDHSWAETGYVAPSPVRVVAREAWWIATFVVPFLYRQARGAGAGRSAKRPELLPVLGPENSDGRSTLAGEAAV
jgi:hypothetical protein